jgi:uncharacterized protein involved in response to NO
MQVIAIHRLFFGAALIEAVASIAVWIFLHPGPASPLSHAHELVFGYGLAVVAGFLFTRTSRFVGLLTLGMWTAARLSWLLLPDNLALPRAALTMASTTVIASLAAWTFSRSIKRGRNGVFPVPLLVLPLCEAMFLSPALGASQGIERTAIWGALLALVALILVMGGRVLGAGLSGVAQRAGRARIPPQAGLELVILCALAALAVVTIFELPSPALAVACWTAGGGVLMRLVQWRGAFRYAGIDLRALGLSQLFVAAALTGIGAQWLDPPWPVSAPLHFLTIGGIGLSTVTMMVRTVAQRERWAIPPRILAFTILSLCASAIIRAVFFPTPDWAYPLAASLWLAAMILVLLWLIAGRPTASAPKPAAGTCLRPSNAAPAGSCNPVHEEH